MAKEQNQRRILSGLRMLAILFLMIAGLLMVLRVFHQYGKQILENQDKQLIDVGKAVDYTIKDTLDRYQTDLEYVTGRSGFLYGEEQWRRTGDSSNLLFRMEENLVARNGNIQTVLAIVQGEVILSTDGSYGYRLMDPLPPENSIGTVMAQDQEGTPYIAFVQKKPDICFAALMPMGTFYHLLVQNTAVDTLDGMILTDESVRIFLYNREGTEQIDWVTKESMTEIPALQALLRNLGPEGKRMTFYQETGEPGKAHTVRLSVVENTDTQNGLFSIGIMSNYEQTLRQLKLAVIRLVAYGGMIILGALLLTSWLRQLSRRSQKAALELEQLRQRQIALEEINRQTMELAHHQRLETIGTLTSSIAHEFNNLLTPIMGYSFMILEKLPPEDTDSYDSALEIYHASLRAKEIISRLSDLSRKNTALTFQYVAPDALVKQVLTVASPAKPKNVQVHTELACSDLWIYGNETQLSQLLLNLVINAYHAMEPEGGSLTVSTGAYDTAVFFSVQDTGCGIPREDYERIFEPFFTTKEAGKGTGLGLAIVQQVVQEHNGTVTVESTLGEGTCFTVTFPITTQDKDESY